MFAAWSRLPPVRFFRLACVRACAPRSCGVDKPGLFTPARVFTTIMLFQLLQEPLTQLPQGLGMTVQVRACERACERACNKHGNHSDTVTG